MSDRPLRDLVHAGVIGVRPDACIDDALHMMRERRISCVVALEQGLPVGIVTERTIIIAAAQNGGRFPDRSVGEFMSSPVTTIDWNSHIIEAYNRITSRGLRHLVVVDEKGLAQGVLTQSDLVRILGFDYLAEVRRTSDVMHTGIISADPDTSLNKAVSVMAENTISCLVVVRDRKPAGIITERDVIGWLHDKTDLASRTVGQVMSSPVRTVDIENPAFDVALAMKRWNMRRLVVVDGQGAARGVITQSDIIRGLESRYIRSLRQRLETREAELAQVGRSLLEKTLFLNNILDSSSLGIAATDRDMRVCYFNQGAQRALGLDAADVIGHDVFDVHARMGMDDQAVRRMLSAMTPGADHEFSFTRRIGDEDRIFESRLSGVWDNGETLLGHVIMLRDVTERARAQHDLDHLNKRLEQIVVERTRDLSRKARELAGANERLRSLDEIKSSFLSSVSHELRTPLTSLLGFAKLITKDFSRFFAPTATAPGQATKAERISRNLDIIVQEGERLTRLINDFLDLSRIEAGRMDWRDRQVTVDECVERVVDSVRWIFDGKPEVRLKVKMPQNLPGLLVDPDRLDQVLLNLLDNAAKYTARGSVELTATAQDDAVRFSVCDTGPGIRAEELATIFDKFRQAKDGDTKRMRPKGTGLGLAICKEIVEHYGGEIWAESETGKGSRFHFRLPVAPHACDRLPAAITGEDGQPLILVVDDDPSVCSYLIQFFEAEGYRVAAARDGASAIAAARELRPDLVTMDLLMPDMDGRQAIAMLRSDPDLSGIPVLIISVLAQDDVQPGDAQAALEKPIDEHRLTETVNALLTRRHRKRLVPVLRQHFADRDRQFFTLLLGDITPCDEQGLWERLQSGFEGTVILPEWAAEHIDIARLQARPGVQILIMPED